MNDVTSSKKVVILEKREGGAQEAERPLAVLLVAWPFPPNPAVGSVRTWNMAVWLRRCGWGVTVLTPWPSAWAAGDMDGRTKRALGSGIRFCWFEPGWKWLRRGELESACVGIPGATKRVCSAIARRCGVRPYTGFFHPAVRAASALPRGRFDVVLGSASPFVTFKVIRSIAATAAVPFVMDYRDSWSGNPHGVPGGLFPSLRLERELIKGAAAVTTVSESIRQELSEKFGCHEKVFVVPNSFDPAELKTVCPMPFSDVAIVYTGRLYPPNRVLDPIFQAIGHLAEDGNHRFERMRVHYFGPSSDVAKCSAARWGVEHLLVDHGLVSREEALAAQRGACLNVVISSVGTEGNPAERGIVTGKVFDCVGAGRPMLVITPKDSDLEAVARSAGVERTYRGSEIDEITSLLRRVLKGDVEPPRQTGQFEWSHTITRLEEALRFACTEPGP